LLAACAFAATLAAAQTETPLKALPYTPSLDVNAMDRTADPCTDLYRYSCGGWMAANPIPQDQSRWSVYGKLYQDNQRFLWGILDDLAKATSGRNANQQKIGDYFAACMDEGAVEKLGARPLKPYLDAIAAIRTKRDLAHVLAHPVGLYPDRAGQLGVRLGPGLRVACVEEDDLLSSGQPSHDLLRGGPSYLDRLADLHGRTSCSTKVQGRYH